MNTQTLQMSENLRTTVLNYLGSKAYNQVKLIIDTYTGKGEYSLEELNGLVNYLSLQPYYEVFRLMNAIEQELSQQEEEKGPKPANGPISSPERPSMQDAMRQAVN